MTVTIKNGNYNREQLELEIRMLKALVDDLQRILEGDYPDEQLLTNSPAITSWKLSARRATCLEGVLFEHPRLGQIVPHGITSELWLLDLDRNYAAHSAAFTGLAKRHRAMRKNETDQATHINRQDSRRGSFAMSVRNAATCHGEPDTKTASRLPIGIERNGMKLWIWSDVHNELQEVVYPPREQAPDCDLIMIAGDLNAAPDLHLTLEFLIRRYEKPIIYVPEITNFIRTSG